jgi:hypothetical protein
MVVSLSTLLFTYGPDVYKLLESRPGSEIPIVEAPKPEPERQLSRSLPPRDVYHMLKEDNGQDVLVLDLRPSKEYHVWQLLESSL